jgi:hypothetical protein
MQALARRTVAMPIDVPCKYSFETALTPLHSSPTTRIHNSIGLQLSRYQERTSLNNPSSLFLDILPMHVHDKMAARRRRKIDTGGRIKYLSYSANSKIAEIDSFTAVAGAIRPWFPLL